MGGISSEVTIRKVEGVGFRGSVVVGTVPDVGASAVREGSFED